METENNPVKSVAQDVVDDVVLGKAILAAYRTGGKAAALALLPQVAAAVRKDFEDVKAALPEIKAGYKTTEFWLTAGIVVINGIYTAVTGKVLPVDLNIVLGGVIAVYTATRGLVKK